MGYLQPYHNVKRNEGKRGIYALQKVTVSGDEKIVTRPIRYKPHFTSVLLHGAQ